MRARPTYSQIQSMLPERGRFTFPAPWNTSAIRLTTGSDCGGNDCVNPVGYSYWRNINNHTASDTMLVVLGLSSARGGSGPTLFRVNKATGSVQKVGPLFPAGSPLRGASGEGWYFSGTQETKLYRNEGSRLIRQDVLTGATQVVFDAASQYGSNRYIWQVHSSDDDRVHSATLRDSGSSEMLGCLVYDEPTARFRYWPKIGALDECHLDKGGRWLMILDNVDGIHGEDDRIIDLTTNTEVTLYDEEGAAGHADTGYGYMVTEDNWAAQPGTVRLWKFGQPYVPSATQGLVVYRTTDWGVGAGHIAHGNAKPGPAESQYACSSTVSRLDLPRANEIVCYRLDGSQKVLVVAPVLTDLNASGGGDDYWKSPKGNIDVTGRYFIWTANMGTNRMDAFLVEVPSQLLTGGASDSTAPTVALTSPAAGVTVSGSVALAAAATDNVSVAGVRFRVDGVDVGGEDTSAPYAATWNSTGAAPGAHVLNAVARDAAGNLAVSAGITVQIAGADTTAPTLSGVQVASVGSSSATIRWTTSEAADSRVEFGATTAYGSSSPLVSLRTLDHSMSLAGLTADALYHFRVISRDAAGNTAKSADGTFRTASAGGSGSSTGSNVTWTQVTNLAVAGSSLEKVSGYNGADDARAISVEKVDGGNAALEFVAGEMSTTRFVGLDGATSPSPWSEIDFSIRLAPWSGSYGLAEVREKGVWRADTPYVAGDKFRIAIEAGVVRYYKNGVAFHQSGGSPMFPLRAHATLFGIGGHVNDARLVLTTSGYAPPPEVQELRFEDRMRLRWSPVADATRYHVYRGRLASLASTTYSLPCRDDLDPSSADTSLVDAEMPGAGACFTYLISAANAGGEGALDASSTTGTCSGG